MVTAAQTVYRQEFIQGFERRQSLLRDTVTTEAVVKGNSAVFLVADSNDSDAVQRGVNGYIPSRQNTNTQYTATLIEQHDLVKHTDFDVKSSQGDQREIMYKNSMYVVNRAIDKEIITQLETATNVTAAANRATLANITSVVTNLFENNVQPDGNVYGVITPKFYGQLMQIPEFASSDYVNSKPLVEGYPDNVSGQRMKDWMNIKWCMHTGLTGMGTSSATCFFYHKSAIGHAVNKIGIDASTGENDEQKYYWARHSVYHGAKLLQNDGVYKFLHDDS